MTDVSTIAPATIRAPRLPKLGLPRLGLGAAFGALTKAYGQALDLAYVSPYRAGRATQPAPVGEDGRDPSW
jgi:hypothetical protein